MHNKPIDTYIVDVIQTHMPRTQSAIQQHLKDRGISIPQATLSRKLHHLRAIKTRDGYTITPYTTPRVPMPLSAHISDLGLIVVHTQPGSASALALFIDQRYTPPQIDSVLGTIAGDDSIFIATKNHACAHQVLTELRAFFPLMHTPQL